MEDELKHLINESPLTFPPTLAALIGLNEAIVLTQVQYWISNPKTGVWHDGHKWVHNTYEEWQKNFPFWTVDGVRGIIYRLESAGYLISAQTSKNPFDHTKSYRIDYDKVPDVDQNSFDVGPDTTSDVGPDTRTFTETTTKTTNTGTEVPLSIENQIYVGKPATSLPKDNDMLKVAEVIAKSFKQDYKLAVDILMAFQKTRGITFLYEDQKKHKKALTTLIKSGVKPEHVVTAVKKLLAINYSVVDLFSISKTAIGLANPAPTSGPKKLEGGYISPKKGL